MDSQIIRQSELEKQFPARVLAEGRDYHARGYVLSSWLKGNQLLKGEVQGRLDNIYDVVIGIARGGQLAFLTSECSCSKRQCKHAAALLYHFLHQQADALQPNTDLPTVIPHQFAKWIEDVKASASSALDKPKGASHRLIFQLSVSHEGKSPRLGVNVLSQRLLKQGGVGKKELVGFTSSQVEKYALNEDKVIIAELLSSNDSYRLNKLINSESLLSALLKTKRCFWSGRMEQALALAKAQNGYFEWILNDDASQKLLCKTEAGCHKVIFIGDSAWYLCVDKATMGRVLFDMPAPLVRQLLRAPEIDCRYAKVIHDELATVFSPKHKILPKHFSKVVQKKVDTITPHLSLFSLHCLSKDASSKAEGGILELPAARVQFDYDRLRVNAASPNELRQVSKNVLYEFARDKQAEAKRIAQLQHFVKLVPMETYWDLEPVNKQDSCHWVFDEFSSFDDILDFQQRIIPELQTLGWVIDKGEGVFSDIVDAESLSWFSELTPSEHDFFSLTLGIEVDGLKIDILPTVIDLLARVSLSELSALDDDKLIILELTNKQRAAIPYSRIKPIIQTLTSLYDIKALKPLMDVSISRSQAALLFEMEQAYRASRLRWYGGASLRELGKKIANFTQVETVSPDNSFLATLRPYQQQGVNWLQFLRSCQLSGVLADDMGLGKTVQALAHLMIEKASNRMVLPTLVIAPTSLMLNWFEEAARFAPKLRCLIYHGDKREQHANAFEQFDLIFTTYELVARDKTLFLDKTFYYVILDEAQRIKNAKAKTTQIIQQLKASHRLCLTGTPLENHLGELWSLFHFLMPGFLGDIKTFTKLYRTPIEKHQQTEVKARLAKRIKPFMLRRLKSAVLKELPAKTEMVRFVELSGSQRDLYESIRLSMEKKVRQAVAKKGLARSHIELLDALLKLRQTCCDPRLLKMTTSHEANSEKLTVLMDLLSTLLEEGRRVLLFSQFTSMLSLIELALKANKINYALLTGQTKDRQKPIEQFQKGEVTLFLISLKAGGTGLNLTEADTVIHYDPWWNPAVEDQATDRSHRIGQKSAVFVYKLIAKGTVEETIQAMQQKKRGLVDGLFGDSEKNKLSLSAADLSELFKPLGE